MGEKAFGMALTAPDAKASTACKLGAALPGP